MLLDERFHSGISVRGCSSLYCCIAVDEGCHLTFRRGKYSSGDEYERLEHGRQKRGGRGDTIERVKYARVDSSPEGREEVFQRVI